MNEKDKIAHLFRRATMGVPVWQNLPEKHSEAIDLLFSNSMKYDEMNVPEDEKIDLGVVVKMDPVRREEFLKDLAANVKLLNLKWIELMASTQSQLREKMALFWHGHLALRGRGVKQVENYIDTIRGYALENFGTMLHEVAKEPAMLQFLNAAQNKKESPNENFARELLELFTMGRGHYTEQDIKEAARAFTGWSVEKGESFKFRPKLHDFGEKTFLGKKGRFSGEDIINIALEQKQTARYIVSKLWKFIVSPEPDTERINELADVFYSSNYEIKPLLKKMFTSDWFYDTSVSKPIIKSPTELLVGITRQFGIKYEDPDQLLPFQRLMGQALFFPPNVSGWAGGRSWIDNTTLIVRLKLSEVLIKNSSLETEGTLELNKEDAFKNEPDGKVNFRSVNCTINWKRIADALEVVTEDKRKLFLTEKLYHHSVSNELNQTDWKDISEEQLKKKVLELTQSLSYQLI